MIDAEVALQGLIAVDTTAAEASVKVCMQGNFAVFPAIMAAGTAKADTAIPVVINHGRWIVECPTGDGGAQYASRDDRRFMCVECLNADIGGLWRPVLWPDDAVEIEAVLDERSNRANQNWLPTETVSDLEAENEANT